MEENPKQKPKPDEPAKLQRDFVLVWINKLAAAFRVELSEATQLVYMERLMTIPMGQLERAFCRTRDEWPEASKWPPLKFILDRVEDFDFLAEQRWKELDAMLRWHWWGELLPQFTSTKPTNWEGRVEAYNGGYLLHPPAFDAATDYALRVAGGLERVANGLYGDAAHFIRRDFCEAYKRHKETVGLIAPSQEEARAFLNSLRAQLPEWP